MLMSAAEYHQSLYALSPRVFVNGERIETVADAPILRPGIEAIGVTYDLARMPDHAAVMTAAGADGRGPVNRMLHVDETAEDLLAKLEAVRLVCRISGCAQRYLAHDAFGGLLEGTRHADAEHGTRYGERFDAWMQQVQRADLAIGIAMTDAKGDRSLRPGQQVSRDTYVHIKERRPDGIVLSGTKAIVTGAPYVHELLVMPCRTHRAEDADCAVICALAVDAPGVTIIARKAGRPGQGDAIFSNRYGQTTAVVQFEDVFVPWERVFMAGETVSAGLATTTYATHHRHSCIAARAGFGDLLIGAAALMIEANGLDADRHPHIREQMVELIKIVEGFYACGIAASVQGRRGAAGNMMPDPVFSNIGKLLLATQIYDMHRIAHTVSGGLIVALPGPDEDHNPETAASLAAVLGGREDIPHAQRMQTARFIEDLTVSDQAGWYSVISLHGGGSPEAMKREIWRNYPVGEKAEVVAALMGRGVHGPSAAPQTARSQPGRCCPTGCQIADLPGIDGPLRERPAGGAGAQVSAGRENGRVVAGPAR
ncbi:4-hydroxyphenylacetate 3-hydroxylase family protein [Profundibacterium mesophilum]|uniref:4-hydroxyphenylacetate-3-hydroxylase large chain n=1 Tax=Profundibacterium mesophilum KAUST100406-0324 TaxID=1037889 RepID=A0A921NSJ3_9RHOB|nr:4-hydroxyphenylacetate 3-hydroxylase N-terminal domain-containing protein [Profundibacterium mesophilum]KAF0677117.1 4-hydroxyphenylacetate-3-hydroxylase large chain [Profundibacterium mesophilum KAUST100406-0324]